jgi:hypothetical protein
MVVSPVGHGRSRRSVVPPEMVKGDMMEKVSKKRLAEMQDQAKRIFGLS